MILKSFQILAICTSMAVRPSSFLYEQPKKANDPIDFSLTIPVTETTVNGINTSSTSKVVFNKGKTTISNSYLNVLACRYIQSDVFKQNANDNQWYITLTDTYNSNANKNTVLYGMQFTPYATTINDKLNLKIHTYLQLSDYTGVEAATINIKFDVYTSTESYWANYIDTTFTTRDQNQSVIENITNPQMGFLYTKETYTMERTMTNSNINVNQEVNINLNPSKTNYIYIMMYLIDPNLGQNAFSTIKLTPGTSTILEPSSNIGTLTGTFVPSVDGYEVIDIPGIMFDVLTMPFTFISVAFNLTLFPNTPYQINISNLFLSIIGALVFMFIIRKLLHR